MGVAAASRYDAQHDPYPTRSRSYRDGALAAMDRAREIAPFSVRYPGLSLDDAYRISARLCALRTARGERVIGRKIGFTNRTIWSEYGSEGDAFAVGQTQSFGAVGFNVRFGRKRTRLGRDL